MIRLLLEFAQFDRYTGRRPRGRENIVCLVENNAAFREIDGHAIANLWVDHIIIRSKNDLAFRHQLASYELHINSEPNATYIGTYILSLTEPFHVFNIQDAMNRFRTRKNLFLLPEFADYRSFSFLFVQFISNDFSVSPCDKNANSRSCPQISSTVKSGFSRTALLMQ